MVTTLHIFDFDDTLATSNAEVLIYHRDGSASRLNSGEFASYTPQKGDKFDFSEFEIYPPGGRTIPSTFQKLQRVISSIGDGDVVVLTARGSAPPVKKFLRDNGIQQPIDVVALGSANPADKGNFVFTKLQTGNYDHVHVYEDNIKNVAAIKNATKEAGVGFSHTLVISETVQKNDVTDLRDFIRETIMQKKSPKIPAAGIILLREFPAGLRILGLHACDRYDLPKGQIEPDEDTFEAALRETKEEAGITEIEFPWGLTSVQANHVTLFLGITMQDPVIYPNPETGEYEHQGASWVTWEELLQNAKSYLLPAIAAAKNIVTDSLN